jgi:pyridoxal phosphate enzyme (YggS family)
MIDVGNNIAVLNERILRAAARAGRSPAEISLVAITKTVPAEVIAEASCAGLREFGENRVQEAEPKIHWSRERGMGLTWHMVGHLQRNKVKKAIQLFDVIQSVDSLPLAREISQRCAQAVAGRLPILLEVNMSGEASKYGFAVHEGDGRALDGFLTAVQEITALPHLEPQGLMTVAPLGAPEEELRSCFRRVRSLLDRLQEQFRNQNWQHLSMGMTDDFEVAIEEGATVLRIGRAIFGERGKLQEDK